MKRVVKGRGRLGWTDDRSSPRGDKREAGSALDPLDAGTPVWRAIRMRTMLAMRPLFRAAALAGVAGLSLAAHQSVAPQGAPADLWIDVAAVDRAGAPVTDLRPQEVEVWISGFRIPLLEVVAVTPAQGGRTVVLLLDDTATPTPLQPRIREAARAFVDLMGPGDRLAVVPLHGGRLELTDDRATLRRALDEFRVRALPFRIEDAGEHMLRTVTSLARGLAETTRGRLVVVGIGTGWIFDAPLAPHAVHDARPAWIEAMRAAASAHLALYVIDPAGLDGPYGRFGGASGFARATGGHAFLNTNDLRGAAARIWQEAGTYYLLGVANPPMQRTADLRELEVKALRDHVTLRVRRAIPGR